ncbi:MAG TPA: plastocyanin/azurin family copper-binding protein [Chthoniobacterales bacterium]|jgi:plastocyanin
MKLQLKLLFALCCASLLPLLNASADTIPVQVGEGGLKFTPQNVTVHVGDTVEWTWAGSDHSTTSGTPGHPDGIWDSGVQNQGFVFDQTFDTEGTFNYYCSIHGTCCGMVGSVIVMPAADRVRITRAQYQTTGMLLLVQATDSDSSATLTVSVTKTGTNLGTMKSAGNGKYVAKFKHLSNPQNITVTSSLGGTDSAKVKTK